MAAFKILVKFPTRQRPEKFFAALEQYVVKAKDTANLKFLITLDTNDGTMNTLQVRREFRRWEDRGVSIDYIYGVSESKIDAVNRDLRSYLKDWDIVLLASDDMIPQVYGYDDIIRRDMKRFFPDTRGCLWYSDGFQERTCTLSIIGKKRYKELGYIYHPTYKTEYCDNEHTEVSVRDKVMSPIQPAIIHHLHPHNLNENKDPLYVRNDEFVKQDKRNFKSRKETNFL